MIYTIIQIIIALILIFLMGIIAYGIYNKNAQEMAIDIFKPNTVKKKTKIIDGVFPYEQTAIFNTTDASNGTYVDVNPSVNQAGGAVYTYNFWLFIPETAQGAAQGAVDKTLILFTKGSSEIIKYKSPFRCNTTSGEGWFLVKNPLVRLDYNNENKVDAIIVEFNSITNPDVYHAGANLADNKCGSRDHVKFDANLFGIKNLSKRKELQNKWNMITIVVSETSAEPNSVFLSSNQVIVKLYLNGYQYLDSNGEVVLNEDSLSTAIKSNRGNLILNPGSDKDSVTSIRTSDKSIAISDLTYFNYTLTEQEIISLFKQGCNKKTAMLPSEKNFDSLSVNEASLEIKGMQDPKAL